MEHIGLTLVGLDLVSLQDRKNVLLLDQNHLLLVEEEGVLVVHTVLLLDEGAATPTLTSLIELLVSEWRRQLNDEADEVSDADPARGVWVVFHPGDEEAVHVVGVDDSEVLQLRVLESFDDRSDREVHDQPRDQKCERHEIHLREAKTAALNLLVVGSESGVGVVVVDAVNLADALRQLVHDLVPVLAGRAPEKQNDRIHDALEIVLLVYKVLVLHSAEQIDAERRVDEQKQKHKADEIRNLRNDVKERIEDQFNVLALPDQPDDTHDPEGADDRRRRREARARREQVQDETDVCCDDDKCIKDVPGIVEVLLMAQPNKLHDHLCVENEGEDVVHVF